MKPKTRKDLRWVPVHAGPLYCSPACGCRCTRAAYEKARAVATAVTGALGADWAPVVWENFGWHSKVRHVSGVEIYLPSTTREQYWATTTIGPQVTAERKTARAVLRALIAELDDLAAHYAAGAAKLRGEA